MLDISKLKIAKIIFALWRSLESSTGKSYKTFTDAVVAAKKIVERYNFLSENVRGVNFIGSGITELYLDCKNLTSINQLVNNCAVTEVHLINTQNIQSWSYTFSGNSSTLKTLDLLDFSGYSGPLGYNHIRIAALENFRCVPGTIKGGDITFPVNSWHLTVESAINIILGLVNYKGTENEFRYSISFYSNTWTLLEAEGATAPGNMTWGDYITEIGWNK